MWGGKNEMGRKIAFIYGGRSTEHDASLKSYESFINNLSTDDFYVCCNIFIDRYGKAYLNKKETTIGEIVDFIKDNNDIFWVNLLHGQEGEDGSWSGIFDIIDGKGTIESVFTSAILMDKYAQSCFAFHALRGMIKIPEMQILKKGDIFSNDKGWKKIVVKPNKMGASHFTEVFYENELEGMPYLADEIFKYSDTALIQEFINGDEYTCGVIKENGIIRTLPVIKVSTESGILGHMEKHKAGFAKVVFMEDDIANKIKKCSAKLFELFQVRGMARFDFIIQNDEIYFLEGNLIPGFSGESAFPMMLKKQGISLNEFLIILMDTYTYEEKQCKFLPYTIE